MIELMPDHADYISVAGLILDKTQTEVQVGTSIVYETIYFEVIEMDGNRIKLVKIIYPTD